MPYIDPELVVSPNLHIGDGRMGVVFDEGISRLQLLVAALNPSDPETLRKTYIRHYFARAMVLEMGPLVGGPIGHVAKSKLIFNISGERVPYEPVAIEVLPQLARVIVPHWFV
jgi:diacylglycerol kinase family enzyme